MASERAAQRQWPQSGDCKLILDTAVVPRAREIIASLERASKYQSARFDFVFSGGWLVLEFKRVVGGWSRRFVGYW